MKRVLAALALLASGLTAVQAEPRASRPAKLLAPGTGECPGGFMLPDTATCLHLGGRVTAESTLQLRQGKNGRDTLFGHRAQSRVELDVRTPTELGPLRLFTSVRGQARSSSDGR